MLFLSFFKSEKRHNLNVLQLIHTYKFQQVSLIGLITFIFFFEFKVLQVNLHLYCNFSIESKIAHIKIARIWKLLGLVLFILNKKKKLLSSKTVIITILLSFFSIILSINLTKSSFANTNITSLIEFIDQLLFRIPFFLKLVFNLFTCYWYYRFWLSSNHVLICSVLHISYSKLKKFEQLRRTSLYLNYKECILFGYYLWNFKMSFLIKIS